MKKKEKKEILNLEINFKDIHHYKTTEITKEFFPEENFRIEFNKNENKEEAEEEEEKKNEKSKISSI